MHGVVGQIVASLRMQQHDQIIAIDINHGTKAASISAGNAI